MTKNSDGFILIDTIISLTIILITLTFVFSLIIQAKSFELSIQRKTYEILERSKLYNDQIENISK